jgi:hypothetical protein
MRRCKYSKCGEVIQGKYPNRKFCTKSHKLLYEKEKSKSLSAYPNLCTGTVGALNELKVCIDLMSKGYEVFRAVSPSCSCDLAILKNKKLIRVEVKTAYRLYTGKIFAGGKKEKFDVKALVLPDKIKYRPKLKKLFSESEE